MNKLAKLPRLITVLSFHCLFNSCDLEIEPLCLTDCWGDTGCGPDCGPGFILDYDTLGDIDGFGIDLLPGELWNPDSLMTSQPIDFRDENDPYFTDIYPATENGIIEYIHSFEIKGTGNIIALSLGLRTIGIQDGEHIDSLGNVDIKLFLDDIEIVNAFEGEFQFELVDNQWIHKVSDVSFSPYNSQFKNLLVDGELIVRIEIVPSSLSNELIDFAIDYSILYIAWIE